MSWTLVLTRHARPDARKLTAGGLEPRAEAPRDWLAADPCRGPPPFERLVGDLAGACSRRISVQHRPVHQGLADAPVLKVLRMGTHHE